MYSASTLKGISHTRLDVFCKRNIIRKYINACGVTSRVRLQKHFDSLMKWGNTRTREMEKKFTKIIRLK